MTEPYPAGPGFPLDPPSAVNRKCRAN
jgi:hypothetical protein